jgi:hypothetical protein
MCLGEKREVYLRPMRVQCSVQCVAQAERFQFAVERCQVRTSLCRDFEVARARLAALPTHEVPAHAHAVAQPQQSLSAGAGEKILMLRGRRVLPESVGPGVRVGGRVRAVAC